MANQLKMAQVQSILELHRQGWSQRRIARELQVNRETVSRYVRLAAAEEAKPAISPAGSEGIPAALDPAISPLGSVELGGLVGGIVPPGTAAKSGGPPGRPSHCQPYQTLIVAKLDQGLTAQRIYQDLVAEQGYSGSYDSVKRFVRRCGSSPEWPVRRLECAPGTEAQVDFGTGAPVIGPDGRRRKTNVFRVVLSHSRKAYSEATYRQTAEDFIRCLENAFTHFGGVPQTLVIDNLKAAVHQPDWFDPELNPKLQSFCEHYGTVVLPTKPRTPQHKGKIERGIGYVKGNALKGRTFSSLEEQNRHLATWEATIADTRIHGTTRRQVGKVFLDIERACLRPLPVERFPFFHEAQRIVSRDGHIEVAKAYYSVPPEYLGGTVWTRWDARLVRVFDQRWRQIAIHARHEQGRFSTHAAHLPREKINGIERGATWLLTKVGLIGPQTKAWAEAMFQHRGIAGLRVLQGLINLARRHRHEALERACGVALSYEAFRLRTVRQLLDRQAPLQESLPFLDEHPLIRPLSDYSQFISTAIWKAPAETAANSDAPLEFSRHGSGVPCHHNEPNLDRLNDRGPVASGTRLRSGYSSSGCAPAEPDSASPDNVNLTRFPSLSQEVLPDE